MKRLVLIGVLIVTLISACISCTLNAEKENAAVAVAEKWLALVDTGKYSESWQEADENFRSDIKQDRWAQLLSARMSLGKVISRKLTTKSYTMPLFNIHHVQSVTINFETSFQGQKSTSFKEAIIVVDKDGEWRVSGYNFLNQSNIW